MGAAPCSPPASKAESRRSGHRSSPRAQREDGSWVPLWFGNEADPNAENPTYGTARVVSALNSISPGRLPRFDHLTESGGLWLDTSQGSDGGWGGSSGVPPSVEETAISVEALAGAGMMEPALPQNAWAGGLSSNRT